MLNILSRFSFSAAKGSPQIVFCIIVIWCLVLLTGIASVLSQPFTAKQRIFWITLMVLLPGLGLLIYIPFSMSEARQALPLEFARKR